MTFREVYQTVFDEDVQPDSSASSCPKCNGRVTTNVVETMCEDCGYLVNHLGVEPRGFPWVTRTLPHDHRPDNLERSGGSRSAGSHSPMPAVAVSEQSAMC